MSVGGGMDERDKSEVRSFYDGCNVFVTGGSGFIGKVLIEKLLRSTHVSKIYVLIRPKKDVTPKRRLDDILNNVIFDKLRDGSNRLQERIVCVSGDCTEPGLGLNHHDRKLLVEDVNIVFNAAASIRFDEHLRLAYKTNINGTIECLSIAREIKNLKAFIHVSTAYSNCIRDRIEEKFYEYPTDYKQVGLILADRSDDEIEQMTPEILGEWPNTYCFTKALTEAYLRDNAKGLPVGIYRPSIVTPTFNEPLRGWIDNLNGVTGGCVGIMNGLIRTLPMDLSKITDLVPADMCVSALIACAWDVHKQHLERTIEDKIPIYNYVSSVERPMTWNEFLAMGSSQIHKYVSNRCLWIISFNPTTKKPLLNLYKIMLHYLPALLLDFVMIMQGSKFRLWRLYDKIDRYMDVTGYFSLRDWKFSNGNVVALWNKMNGTDRELFKFSITNLCWLTYIRHFGEGIRKYILKEPEDNIETARKRYKRFAYAHLALKLLFLSTTLIFLQRIFRKICG